MAHCKANQLDTHGFCNRFDAPCIKKNCRFFGVKTNADRIRAMTDEELVEHFGEFMPDDKFCTGVCNERMDCNVCRLAWLQQPAEDK